MRTLAILAASLVLVSCGGGGGDDNGNPDDPSVWHFRGVNAIADAPQIQFYVDNTAVNIAEYSAITEYKPAHTGERPLKVAVQDASTLDVTDLGYTDIGDEESYDFQGPTNYTLVSGGTQASPRQFLITDTSRGDVEDNKVEYQVIHAAVSAGSEPLAVYVSAPGAGISGYTLVDQLALGEYTDKTNLDLQIATGDEEGDARSTDLSFLVKRGNTTIFRSNNIGVAEQSRLLAVIADNQGATGASVLKVLVFPGVVRGSATVLLNRTDKAELRFANVSPDAGPMDLIVGTSTADVFAPNIAFSAASDYKPLTSGTYNSIGTPAGNPGMFYFVNSIAATLGRSYSLYGQGPQSAMRGVLILDDRRVVPSEAHFRFFYAANSESGTALDIYLTKRGEELDLDAETPPVPRVANLAYRAVSSQLALDGGSYDAYLMLANSKDILLGPVPLDLADGSVQTLALVNNPGGDLELASFNDAGNDAGLWIIMPHP